jgi:hypothetical protein
MLENLPDLHGRSYDPRLLRIPGLYIEAFWLKPLSPGDETDLVVPYHTPLKDLDPAKPYPIKDFLDRIRPLAEQALAVNDSPKAGRPLRSSA